MMFGDQSGQSIEKQIAALAQNISSNSSHAGQQVPHVTDQSPLPRQNPLQNHQVAAPKPSANHARLFPNMKAKEPLTVPLRLENSTKPKVDLSHATLLQPSKDLVQPSNNPNVLSSLFSATLDAQKGVTGKSLESGRPRKGGATCDGAKTRTPKSSTFKQLNEDLRRKLDKLRCLPSSADKRQGTSRHSFSGAPDARVTKRQGPTPTGKPSTGPGSPQTAHYAPRSGVGATPVSSRKRTALDATTLKVIHHSFQLGILSAAKDVTQGKSVVLKEIMPPEDMAELMTQIPEFFKNQEDSSQECSHPPSGFTPPPPPGLAPTAEAGEDMPSAGLDSWSDMPMVDGSGSAQRIPSADVIQSQMEQAMKGHSKAQSHPTPTRAQVGPVSMISNQQTNQNGVSGTVLSNMNPHQQPEEIPGQALGTVEPSMTVVAKTLQAGGRRISPGQGTRLPDGSASPFQINDGRAHIDQEALRQQTKSTDGKVAEPKRGRKRAAPKVSRAGKQEREKPKRKRTYKKRNAATPVPTAANQERDTAAADRIDTAPPDGTLPVGTGIPNLIADEKRMPNSGPTIGHNVTTKEPMPTWELETWVWSVPPTGEPRTEKQRAELDALYVKTAARINSASGQTDNTIDLMAIDAL